MSAEYDHLAPECREEANLPPLERIRRIQAERWIGYPRAELVLNRLNELLHYPQRDRMPCLLLYAATGMGKTKILLKFRREHPDASRCRCRRSQTRSRSTLSFLHRSERRCAVR
jgi:hypothetical protein